MKVAAGFEPPQVGTARAGATYAHVPKLSPRTKCLIDPGYWFENLLNGRLSSFFA
jgi:hypothetical protein